VNGISSTSDVDIPADTLRRLHPLTPYLRSWRMVGAALAIGFGFFRDDLGKVRLLWDVVRGEADLAGQVQLRLLAVGLTGALVVIGGAWLSWRVTGYALVSSVDGPSTLRFHRGLFVRQRRQVRLNRVQSVDVNRPFVARLLGLAVLQLDMAAGEDASVSLAYLSVHDATGLREEILRHTAAGRPGATADAAGAPFDDTERLVARVSTQRLIQANLLESAPTLVFLAIWLVALVVLGLVLGAGGVAAGLGGIIPVSIAIVVQLRERVLSLLRDANFSLFARANGVRISAGMTSTVNRTIDADRFQGIRVEEPFLWRQFGWARVEIDVAGAADSSKAARLMPVADRGDALALARSVTGVDFDSGEVRTAGAQARRLDPLGWQGLGVVLHEHGAITRSGRWRKRASYVPYARTQSVSVRQGIVQRRLGLASAYLDMPEGVDRWTAPHRDVGEAVELCAELAERARLHRMPGSDPVTVSGTSEPALDAGHPSADHQAQHQTADEPAAGVQHRPRQEREPADEHDDHSERR